MLGIVTGVTAHRHPQSFRMNKIPMAALAAPALKPGLFQVGYQLANLARHLSIKIVSQLFKTVKRLNLAIPARKNCSIPEAEINLLKNCPRIVAACRQTAAIFCKTKECGSLPRSRYAVLSGLEHLLNEIIPPICGCCVEAGFFF
jgi:hypothetical protein